MAIKLLHNVIHNGVLLHAEEIIEGIEDEVCADIVKRGLAVETEEAPTKAFTASGVEPKSAVNPADAHTAPRDQSTTSAVAGQSVVPAATTAPSDQSTASVPVQAPVSQPVVAPQAPQAPQVPQAPQTGVQPTPEDISNAVEGV